jgi:hypothetical protein
MKNVRIVLRSGRKIDFENFEEILSSDGKSYGNYLPPGSTSIRIKGSTHEVIIQSDQIEYVLITGQ